MDDPSKRFEIICDKHDKKDNNKLSNLCKELESCTFKNIKFNTDDWFGDFSHLNDSIEKIIIDFNKIPCS